MRIAGEEGMGWTIAKYLLTHEREMISGFGLAGGGKSMSREALELIGTDPAGRLDDTVLRQQLAQWELDAMVFGLHHDSGRR